MTNNRLSKFSPALVLALAAFIAALLAPGAMASVDVTAPTISGVSPADGSTIYTTSATISAYYADEPGGSGIDATSAMVHVDNRMIMTGCSISDTSISCPKSGLAYGSHKLEIFIMDVAGNEGVSTTYFNVGDNVAPTVTFTGPIDWPKTTSPTITGTVSDPAPTSGIAAATVTIRGTVFPCSVDAGNLSCPTSGLPEGHSGLTLSAIDNAGNTGSASGMIMISLCTGERPSLSLQAGKPYWASYADFQNGILSLGYTVSNTGTLYAFSVKMTDSSTTNGVICLTTMPKSFGSIAQGASKTALLQYQIPRGVGSFRTINSAGAMDGCGAYVYP